MNNSFDGGCVISVLASVLNFVSVSVNDKNSLSLKKLTLTVSLVGDKEMVTV